MTILPHVTPTRVPKKHMIGRLIKSLTCSTTDKVKTQQVIRSRGQHCGDIELMGYLVNQTGPVPLVVDLRISHERFGRSSDLIINGNLHYPNDEDRSLNESATDKILKYRAEIGRAHV